MTTWYNWHNFGIHFLIFTIITSIKMVLDAKSIVPAEIKREEISPYWSFNESADISKYENFDHRKFLKNVLHIDISDMVTDDQPPPIKLRTTTLAPSTSTPEPIIHVGTTNLTVQLGSTALLHCEIGNLTDKVVSWVRRRDWHILSTGVLTYINDGRFRVFYSEKSDDWDLRISPVLKIDNGTYECQVGTDTGIMTHYLNLFVIVPTAVITGNNEYHIGEGSSISLHCKIENSPIPPQYVLWYHNGKIIPSSLLNENGLKNDRVSISTEQMDRKMHSRLIISKTVQKDTGNYTCQPPNTDSDSTYIHITPEFDNTAAIQRHKSSNSALLATELSLIALMSFFLFGHDQFRWMFL